MGTLERFLGQRFVVIGPGRFRVERQSELVDLLRARGIEATQSSISRDLKQLGIAKLADGYKPAPGDPPAETEVPARFIRSIETAGPNITVIQTPIGAAQRVAVILDRSGWPEIVGTVSGDDTIFVATRNRMDQKQLIVHLRNRFPGENVT